MQLVIRFLVIIGVVWLCVYALTPTYDWYFSLNEEQKALANTSKKDFRLLTQSVESNAQIIKSALKDPDHYRIALSERDKENQNYAINLSDDNPLYTLSLPYSNFLSVLDSVNPTYRPNKNFEKNYSSLSSDIAQLEKINQYQQIKNRVIKLGLDIAGGVHFSLGIDDAKTVEILDNQYTKLLDPKVVKASVSAKTPGLSASDLNAKVQERLSELKKEKQDRLSSQKDMGIDQALTKIRNRIDQFGVSEPIILKGPNNTIVVELAGEKDTESAKEIFTRVGVLSFQVVNENWMKTVPLENRSFSGYLKSKDIRSLPSDTQLLPVQGIDRFGQPFEDGYLPVYKKVELDGSHLVSAQAERNNFGQHIISFRFDSTGGESFANITRNNVGKRLAIVLDGLIQSAPNIREAILGGSGTISGSFSLKEANLLSTILKSGSLPVPLKIEEQKVIGPSLGLEEIQKGIKATIIALIVVMIFMFIYYGFWGGLSTNLAQVLNILIILAIMAQLNATLTLPGLAAIVLTIGMSVDANIIIHERIKEDMRAGFSLKSAIVSGYHSALTTILDSNTTTFIPGFILGSIGDGPIRGFGIVLMIGLVVNLFTAIFVTRTFYNLIVGPMHIKNIFWSRLSYGK